jgi:uncharacterized protein (DUF433 family)
MAGTRDAYRERIGTDPEILFGKPVVRGTRIAVEQVLDQIAVEPDVATVFDVFPDLTVEDVRACLVHTHTMRSPRAIEG